MIISDGLTVFVFSEEDAQKNGYILATTEYFEKIKYTKKFSSEEEMEQNYQFKDKVFFVLDDSEITNYDYSNIKLKNNESIVTEKLLDSDQSKINVGKVLEAISKNRPVDSKEYEKYAKLSEETVKNELARKNKL